MPFEQDAIQNQSLKGGPDLLLTQVRKELRESAAAVVDPVAPVMEMLCALIGLNLRAPVLKVTGDDRGIDAEVTRKLDVEMVFHL